MIIVMKFGGTAINKGERFIAAANLVKQRLKSGDQIVAVVSAMAGVTSSLKEMGEKASYKKSKFVNAALKEINQKHTEALSYVCKGRDFSGTANKEYKKLMEELKKAALGVLYIGEISRRSMDYLQSFGENLSSMIMKYSFNSVGLKSKYMTGGECGILTDNNYSDAKPLMEASRTQIGARLKPLIEKGMVPVVAGFTGQTQEGDVTTLGRGGADYTATVIASALGAAEVYIWSGVDGLMTADPEIEPKAQVIPKVSYQEALEMAYFGATILHPRALEPTEELGIPVRIKNLFKPDSEGTLITSPRKETSKDVAKAVTLIRNVALIFIGGAGMVGAPAVAAKAFNALNKLGLHALMISQGSSQSNISLIVPRNEMERAVSALELTLTGTNYISNVSYEEGLCVIAAVGEGMRGTPGVAARVFKAIAEKGINVRMIAQGSSEANISFVVKEGDGEQAIRALHKEFELYSG